MNFWYKNVSGICYEAVLFDYDTLVSSLVDQYAVWMSYREQNY